MLIETSSTTDGILKGFEEGKIKKSEDRMSLIDENGNVVATRVAYRGDTDYYQDVQQNFHPDCVQVCVQWKCSGGTVCVCVSWGCK